MMNDEDNANNELTNGSRTRLFKLQQEIHDALRVQHPDWIEPNGVVLPANPMNLVLLNCSVFRRPQSPPACTCLAPKARQSRQAWGKAPGFLESLKTAALKARLTSATSWASHLNRTFSAWLAG